MTVFPTSIRWRLQLWLAFLLVGLLSGFAATMYELQRLSQLHETDARLDRRLALVSGAFRSGGPSSSVGGARLFRRRWERVLLHRVVARWHGGRALAP